jgi:ATP-dependent DNA helicase PIF1
MDLLERSNHHFFITGRAGTGKSTLLQLFRNTTKKRVVVLAPTGISALHVKGQTIHSFFRFPPKLIDRSSIRRIRGASLYKKLDSIIIDEVSMVRVEMIDHIDAFLRINRSIDEPFGGIQMIFIGDLFQLPPVISTPFEKEYLASKYDSPYFFSADIFEKDCDLELIELHEVHRQKDKAFIRLLDNIRTNSFDFDDLDALNSRYKPNNVSEELSVILSPRNHTVQQINTERLGKIDAELFQYSAGVSGDVNESVLPTDVFLKLKVGAQVMFLKNDPEKQFVNGTLGIISYLDDHKIKVLIDEDSGEQREVEVEKMEWDFIRYELEPDKGGHITEKVVGRFTQYPLKLAWAMTIHKSQGKTFSQVIIDLAGGAFEFGQLYVALSRCTSIEGITLLRPVKPADVKVDERISEYLESVRRR